MKISDLFEMWSPFHKPADFGYRTDNPGREDCLRKRRTVEKLSDEQGGRYSEGLGAKMCTGWPTAHMGIVSPLYFPVSNLAHLDGVNNEHHYRREGDPKYDSLQQSVDQHGWLDRHPVMVRINHRGLAYIVEGNTRVRIALKNNVKYIRAQFEWMNGVEEEDGPWSPERVAEISVKQPLEESWKFYGLDDDEFKPREMTEPKVLYRSVSLPELEDIFYIGKVMGGQNRFNDFDQRRWVFFADEITEQLIHQGEELERQAVHALQDHGLHRDFKRLTQEIEDQGSMIYFRMEKLNVPVDPEQEDNFQRGENVNAMERTIKASMSLSRENREWFKNAIQELYRLHRERHALRDQYGAVLKQKHGELVISRKEQAATSAIIVTRPISGGIVYSDEWGQSGFQTPEYGFHPGQVTVDDIEKVILVRNGKTIGQVPLDRVLTVVRKILGIL